MAIHDDIDHSGIPGVGGSVATDAIWDAKGDLAVGTGANTAQKLTAGTNGHVLTLDSGETTGVKWAAAAGSSLGLCLVKNSGTQSRAANSAFVFDTDISDAGNWHDTGSNTSRIVVPATGIYLLWFGSFCDGSPGSGPLLFKIDGTTNVVGSGVTPLGAAAYQHTIAVAAVSSGSYVEAIMAAANTVNWGHASVLDAQTTFAVVRLL